MDKLKASNIDLDNQIAEIRNDLKAQFTNTMWISLNKLCGVNPTPAKQSAPTIPSTDADLDIIPNESLL